MGAKCPKCHSKKTDSWKSCETESGYCTNFHCYKCGYSSQARIETTLIVKLKDSEPPSKEQVDAVMEELKKRKPSILMVSGSK